jgi:hypothetical protein
MAITDYRGKKDRRAEKLYSEITLTKKVEESRSYTVRRDFDTALKVLSSTVHDLSNARQLGYLDDSSATRVARYAWQSAHMLSGLADEEPEVDYKALSLIKTLERDFEIKKFPLVKKLAMAASILSFFGGIFLSYSSLSLTGKVINSFNFASSSLIGTALIVLGILGVFYSTRDQARMAWLEKRKRRDRDFRRDNSGRERQSYKGQEDATYEDFEER